MPYSYTLGHTAPVSGISKCSDCFLIRTGLLQSVRQRPLIAACLQEPSAGRGNKFLKSSLRKWKSSVRRPRNTVSQNIVLSDQMWSQPGEHFEVANGDLNKENIWEEETILASGKVGGNCLFVRLKPSIFQTQGRCALAAHSPRTKTSTKNSQSRNMKFLHRGTIKVPILVLIQCRPKLHVAVSSYQEYLYANESTVTNITSREAKHTER